MNPRRTKQEVAEAKECTDTNEHDDAISRRRANLRQLNRLTVQVERRNDHALQEYTELRNGLRRIQLFRMICENVFRLLDMLREYAPERFDAANLKEHFACLRLAVARVLFSLEEMKERLAAAEAKNKELKTELDFKTANLATAEEELQRLRGCR